MLGVLVEDTLGHALEVIPKLKNSSTTSTASSNYPEYNQAAPSDGCIALFERCRKAVVDDVTRAVAPGL
jgi:hypothetical protein